MSTNIIISEPKHSPIESIVSCSRNAVAPGKSPAEVIEYYDKQWSKTYDEDAVTTYNAPKYAALTVHKYCQGHELKYRILDVAAGTGLVGDELKQLGYEIVDALDPSEKMIEKAKAKNFYRKYFMEIITGEKTSIEDQAYDVLVSAGGFANGHIPHSALREMARLVRPGGFIINVIREEYLEIVADYKDKLEPLMDEMEREGVWRKEERTIVPDYFLTKRGVIYVYKKL